MHTPDLQSRRTRSDLRCVRLAAIPLVTAGLIAAVLPAQPVAATVFDPYNPSPYRARTQDYRACAERLKGEGIADADAASACGAALAPRDLGTCVDEVTNTSIAATDALSGCRRVRRPVELAICVTDISGTGVEQTMLLDVLDSCRRSLLPRRFSNCVVGLKNQLSLATNELLTTCIAASSRPREVYPNFIPRTGVPPAGGFSTPDFAPTQPAGPTQDSIPTPPPQSAPESAPQSAPQ